MFKFKELFSWWKEDVLMKTAFENVKSSLKKSADIFSYALKASLEGSIDEDKIHEMDREINTLQVDTRRKVLEHLTIKPAQDIIPSLVWVTIIVDIERIGDYSKNIGELTHFTPHEIKGVAYITELNNIGIKLESLFKNTLDALIYENPEIAKIVATECTEINYQCENGINSIAEASELLPREIVFYTLFFRYLKRVSSHLRNISTSILNPFDRIGYKPQS